MPSNIPDIRIDRLNDQPIRADGRFVLYWMSSARRPAWNFGLDRAVELAVEHCRPLLVVETLACDAPWMNPRHGALVLAGMEANAKALRKRRAGYVPCVAADSARLARVLDAAASKAVAVVADWWPLREAAQFTTDLADVCPVQFERVDSNGLLPLAATDHAYPTAHAFRRFLQRALPDHVACPPAADWTLPPRFPRADGLDVKKSKNLLATSEDVAEDGFALMVRCSKQPEVRPVTLPCGSAAGGDAVLRFLEHRLPRYATERNQPEGDAPSGLSPYLHHGHVSPHFVFAVLAQRQKWSPDRLAERVSGSREGWWGMDASAESFLDELVTWRELGFNMTMHRDDYDDPESLPEWARRTLADHAGDRRSHEYSFETFRDGSTHDELWNAAQGQLRKEGIIHNYLRMLWGKKILEWSPDWPSALETMIALNNTYAVDGCDPNSYSGIFWVLGRYDRAWGPERAVYGKVRYMSSANTARKVRVRTYVKQYSRSQA